MTKNGNLEPGLELDELVAEKVIGMRRVSEGEHVFWPSPEMIAQLKEMYPDAIAFDYMAAPRFSTDISHTWMIIEKLDWVAFEVWLEVPGTVSVTFRDGELATVQGHARDCQTIPQAICLAALDVIGERK